jgi:hypothetical protein
MLKRILIVAACALAMLPAQTLLAAEVAGVDVPASAKVGGADLQLNGAGLRTRVVFKIYVGALYLAEKKTSAEGALTAPGAKRVALFLLRDLTAEELTGALTKALDNNLTESERARFKPQISQLEAVMGEVGAARQKSVVALDFIPGAGTRISVDGAAKGKAIAGDDFFPALMKIWLGERPVEPSLKAAILGQGQG